MCIPSAILCGQGPMCRSQMVFSMLSLARATWRGALAISDMSHNNCDRMESSWDLYPLIWRIQKRRQRCRRRLLKSATSQCEWVCAWACAFATSFSVNRLLLLWRKWWILFWYELRSFIARKLSGWLSSGLYWCCEVAMHVEETHRNASNPAHPLLKPCAMQVWNPV